MSRAVRKTDGSIGYESTIAWKRDGDVYRAEVGGITVEIHRNQELGLRKAIRPVYEIHHRGHIVARRPQVNQAKHIGENFLRLTVDQILYGLSGLAGLT